MRMRIATYERGEQEEVENKNTQNTQFNLNTTSSGNPRSTSNQSRKPCTVLQYPSRKAWHVTYRSVLSLMRIRIATYHNRDPQKRPTKETHKRDPQKRPTKETHKRDPQKRSTKLMRMRIATYGRVSPHVWMCHVPRMDETCHTYEWVISHINTQVSSHLKESVWMCHVTCIYEKCHTYEWVISHMNT